jgi:hypothetical protein
LVAREEREVMIKEARARNGSFAKWIDFVSTLRPEAEAIRLEGAGSPAGFRFVASHDENTTPECRESADWRAVTFVSEEMTYTAVCFNHPSNPKPLTNGPVDRNRPVGDSDGSGRIHALGYAFTARLEEANPLQVRYRLWIQGGRMPTEEIQAMSTDFLEPIKIDVK